MKKILFLFSFLILISCSKKDYSFEHPEFGEQDIVTDATGVEYPALDPNVISYCGPGWGRKFCRFLLNYDGTVWEDSENYYSDFSDIKFSRFNGNNYFISFFDFDKITSYCKGWKLGETIYNGNKWIIKIKKDQVDKLWFSFDYYGTSEEIEYTLIYKYEVINGLLHYSRSDGQTFVFRPSTKNYSENLLDTDEIITLEGCIFL